MLLRTLFLFIRKTGGVCPSPDQHQNDLSRLYVSVVLVNRYSNCRRNSRGQRGARDERNDGHRARSLTVDINHIFVSRFAQSSTIAELFFAFFCCLFPSQAEHLKNTFADRRKKIDKSENRVGSRCGLSALYRHSQLRDRQGSSPETFPDHGWSQKSTVYCESSTSCASN